MKRYIMTLIAFSLSVMAINGAEQSDGIDAFPYRDLIEKYVVSSDFDKQKDIVIATRLLSKFSKYPYLIFGAFTQEDLPYFGKKLPEQTSDIGGIRIIETYNTECIRNVFSQLFLKFDPFWQSKINVTDYTFWILSKSAMTELFSWTQMQHQDINCHLLSYGDYVASKISVVSFTGNESQFQH